MFSEERGRTGLTSRIAADQSRRLVDRLARLRDRRGIWPSVVLVRVLATLIHLTTASLLGAGAWLLATGDTGPLRVLGGLGVATAIAFVPRLPRLPRGPAEVKPDGAPELFRLVDEVAAAVSSPVPDRIFFDPSFNASTSIHRRGTRVLTLGAPLWVASAPQARVALLAHELGHFANRDSSNRRFVGSAVYAIGSWIEVLEPQHGGFAVVVMTRIVTWPVRAVLVGLLRIIWLADLPSHRRQEHYADLAAVLAAGTDGAVDLLETMLAEVGVEVAGDRARSQAGPATMRAAIQDHMASYGVEPRQRNRLRAASEKVRIDASHPPTTERLRLVESVEAVDGLIVVDEHRAARLDAELEAVVDAELARLADLRRGW